MWHPGTVSGILLIHRLTLLPLWRSRPSQFLGFFFTFRTYFKPTRSHHKRQLWIENIPKLYIIGWSGIRPLRAHWETSGVAFCVKSPWSRSPQTVAYIGIWRGSRRGSAEILGIIQFSFSFVGASWDSHLWGEILLAEKSLRSVYREYSMSVRKTRMTLW